MPIFSFIGTCTFEAFNQTELLYFSEHTTRHANAPLHNIIFHFHSSSILYYVDFSIIHLLKRAIYFIFLLLYFFHFGVRDIFKGIKRIASNCKRLNNFPLTFLESNRSPFVLLPQRIHLNRQNPFIYLFFFFSQFLSIKTFMLFDAIISIVLSPSCIQLSLLLLLLYYH